MGKVSQEKSVLTGKWFHSFKDGDLDWQGQILSIINASDTAYLFIQLYSWISGTGDDKRLVKLCDITNWVFYDTHEEMKDAFIRKGYGNYTSYSEATDDVEAPRSAKDVGITNEFISKELWNKLCGEAMEKASIDGGHVWEHIDIGRSRTNIIQRCKNCHERRRHNIEDYKGKNMCYYMDEQFTDILYNKVNVMVEVNRLNSK